MNNGTNNYLKWSWVFSMEDLVTIIIPVYNTGSFLDRCIKSVLNQLYLNIEIILVDDGSTDGSAQKCDEYASLDRRVKVIHKANGGVSSARNVGLNAAKGRYISFVDADDWIEPSFIGCLVANMIETKADLSAVCFKYEYGHGCETNFTVYAEYQTFIYEKEDLWKQILYSTKIGGFLCNKLFKKEFITQMLDEKLHYCEDFVFTAEYCRNVKKMVFVDLPLYHYQQERGNATSDFSYNLKILTLVEAYKRLEEIYKEYSPENFDNIQKNTLKIALNLRARYKFGKINNEQQYHYLSREIYCRLRQVLRSRKVKISQKFNILATWIMPVLVFRIKNFVLGRGV